MAAKYIFSDSMNPNFLALDKLSDFEFCWENWWLIIKYLYFNMLCIASQYKF